MRFCMVNPNLIVHRRIAAGLSILIGVSVDESDQRDATRIGLDGSGLMEE